MEQLTEFGLLSKIEENAKKATLERVMLSYMKELMSSPPPPSNQAILINILQLADRISNFPAYTDSYELRAQIPKFLNFLKDKIFKNILQTISANKVIKNEMPGNESDATTAFPYVAMLKLFEQQSTTVNFTVAQPPITPAVIANSQANKNSQAIPTAQSLPNSLATQQQNALFKSFSFAQFVQATNPHAQLKSFTITPPNSNVAVTVTPLNSNVNGAQLMNTGVATQTMHTTSFPAMNLNGLIHSTHKNDRLIRNSHPSMQTKGLLPNPPPLGIPLPVNLSQPKTNSPMPPFLSLHDELIVAGLIAFITILEKTSRVSGDHFLYLQTVCYSLALIDSVRKNLIKVSPKISKTLEAKFQSYIDMKQTLQELSQKIKIEDRASSEIIFLNLFISDSLKTNFPEIYTTVLSFFLFIVEQNKHSCVDLEKINSIIAVGILNAKSLQKSLALAAEIKIHPSLAQSEIESILDIYNTYLEKYINTKESFDLNLILDHILKNITFLIQKVPYFVKNNLSNLAALYFNLKEINLKMDLSSLVSVLDDHIQHLNKFNSCEITSLYLFSRTNDLIENNKSLQSLDLINAFLFRMTHFDITIKKPHLFLREIARYISHPIQPALKNTNQNSRLLEIPEKAINIFALRLAHKIMHAHKGKITNDFEEKLQAYTKLFIENFYPHTQLKLMNNQTGFNHPEFFSYLITDIINNKIPEQLKHKLSLLNTYLNSKKEYQEIFFACIAKQSYRKKEDAYSEKFFAEVLIAAIEKSQAPYSLLPLIHSNIDVLAAIIDDGELVKKYAFQLLKNSNLFHSLSADNLFTYDFVAHKICQHLRNKTYVQAHFDVLGLILSKIINTDLYLFGVNLMTGTQASQHIKNILGMKDSINSKIAEIAVLSIDLMGDFQQLNINGWSLSHTNLANAVFSDFTGYTGQETAKISGAHINGSFEVSEIVKFSDVDVSLKDETKKKKYHFNFGFTVGKQKSFHSSIHTDPYTAGPLCAQILAKKNDALKKELETKDKTIAELKQQNNSKKRKAENDLESSPHKYYKIDEPEKDHGYKSGFLFKGILKAKNHAAKPLDEKEIDQLLKTRNTSSM